jgi:hypothetical protein
MTQAAAQLLPHAIARVGLREPAPFCPERDRDRHRCGGILPAGREPGHPGSLDLHITGDPDCAAIVLAAASTLALD